MGSSSIIASTWRGSKAGKSLSSTAKLKGKCCNWVVSADAVKFIKCVLFVVRLDKANYCSVQVLRAGLIEIIN